MLNGLVLKIINRELGGETDFTYNFALTEHIILLLKRLRFYLCFWLWGNIDLNMKNHVIFIMFF